MKKITAIILIITIILTVPVFALDVDTSKFPAETNNYKNKILYDGGNGTTYLAVTNGEFYLISVNNTNFITSKQVVKEYIYNPTSNTYSYYVDTPAGNAVLHISRTILYRNCNVYTDSTLTNKYLTIIPPVSECTIYTVRIGDTINIDNNTTSDGFFYLYAHDASYEEIIAIGNNYPIVTTHTNIDSGEWEWMEPEPDSNYNYWKVTSGYIEIGIPNDSALVIKKTTKAPSGGYDVNPSPDRNTYEDGIFGTISYGIDTLVYWVSYPFVAVGNMIVSVIDEIKLNLNWITDFNSIVQMLFGWIPERFQGLLFICISTMVISLIVRVFRGS